MKTNKNIPKKFYPLRPTGDLMSSDDQLPITVPVPLPVVFCEIDGAYTAFDRKLWVLLLHLEWDNLLTKSKIGEWHEIKESDLSKVIQEYTGGKDIEQLWQSAKRLTKTTVEFVFTDKDGRWNTISGLFSAQIFKKQERDGIFRFMFPAPLIPLLLEPKRFARLRLQFMLKLNSKYAVTLYEMFEGYTNRDTPIIEATIKELRSWLKVPEGKLVTWKDFHKYALQPALKEINANPELSGMSVKHELIRSGKGGKVQKVKFVISKDDTRIKFEDELKTSKSNNIIPFPTIENVEPLEENLQEVVDLFAATFNLPNQQHPSQTVINKTQSVLDKHGIKKTKFIIKFARKESLTTNYSPKTFSGIMQYVDEALKLYEEQERLKIKKEVEKQQLKTQQVQNAHDKHQQIYSTEYFSYIEALFEAVMYRYPVEFVEFQKKESFLLQNIEQEIELATKKTQLEILETKRRVLTGQSMKVERLVAHFNGHPTVKIPDFWAWDTEQNTKSFENRRGLE